MGQTAINQQQTITNDDSTTTRDRKKTRVIPLMTRDRKKTLQKFIDEANQIIDVTILVPISPKNQAPFSFSLRNKKEKGAWMALQYLFQTFNHHYIGNVSLKTTAYFKSFGPKNEEELKQKINCLCDHGRSLFGIAIFNNNDK